MKIIWAENALADLEAIRTYIARDSEYYAARFTGKLVKAVDILERFPQIGAAVLEVRPRDVRELLFRNCRIFYEVRADHVIVVAIVHGARDLTSMKPKPWDVS